METARERESYDWLLLALTIFLLILGTTVVLDASFARALQSEATNKDAFFFFKKQLRGVIFACVALYIGLRTPYWKLKNWRYWGLGTVIAIVLLVLVLIPGIGKEVNGSRRWLGAGPFQFQPSEFAKIAMVLFLARYSDLWRGRIRHLTKGFIPPVLMVVAIGGLVAKEDLGTAITIVGTGLLMIFAMGARPTHFFGLIVLALLAGVGLILAEPYRLERIQAWVDLIIHPVKVHSGPAYQPAQGLIALGSGGLAGQGIMRGSAKHMYLPAEHTDYIYATIGEEAGLLGCLLVLICFAVLVIRGLTIAHRTRDWFGSLLAGGLTALIGIQAFLNIAVVTGLVPCTGVPLPFISYGGTSVVFTALAVGIILNVSQYPNGSAAEAKERETGESRADGWRNRRAHLSRT
jgi:cell division protein FtsW